MLSNQLCCETEIACVEGNTVNSGIIHESKLVYLVKLLDEYVDLVGIDVIDETLVNLHTFVLEQKTVEESRALLTGSLSTERLFRANLSIFRVVHVLNHFLGHWSMLEAQSC